MLNESRSVSDKRNPNKGEFARRLFFPQVNDITFHIIMGSKSVTLGEVRKAVKTCLLILPNDQSYSSLKTLLKYEQRFLFLKKFKPIDHFRVPPGLCFKTRVGAQPLMWKSFFILIQIKHIFTRKVVHLQSGTKVVDTLVFKQVCQHLNKCVNPF